MRLKGALGNIFKLEVGEDGRTVERVLQYTGRVSYEEPSIEESREWIQRLYHICEENVVGRTVNVGTVGHIDHGRRGYRPNMADISWSTPHVKSYYNPFQPEWIYWWEGLIYVGGRVIHNLRIYEDKKPPEEGVICDSISPTEGHSKEYEQIKKMVVSRMNKGTSGKAMPPEITSAIEDFLRPTGAKVNPIRIMHEYERDRRTVIPSRKSIQWAIEMTHWKDKDLFKILGMDQLSPDQLADLRWKRTNGQSS